MTSLLPHFLFLLLLKKNTFTLQQQPEFIFFLSTASLWNHWIINCVSRFQVKKNRRVACFPNANFCPWRRIHRPTSLAQSLDIREQIYSSLTILWQYFSFTPQDNCSFMSCLQLLSWSLSLILLSLVFFRLKDFLSGLESKGWRFGRKNTVKESGDNDWYFLIHFF